VVRLNGEQMRERLEKLLKQTEAKKNGREEKDSRLKVTNGKAS
jgi:hypothetical protein